MQKNPQTSRSQNNSVLSASAATIPQTDLSYTERCPQVGHSGIRVSQYFSLGEYKFVYFLFLVELVSTTRCDFCCLLAIQSLSVPEKRRLDIDM